MTSAVSSLHNPLYPGKLLESRDATSDVAIPVPVGYTIRDVVKTGESTLEREW